MNCLQIATQYGMKNLLEMMNLLTPREKMMINMRYFERKTLEEVGNRFGITIGRARQIILVKEQRMYERLFSKFGKQYT